MAPGIGGADLGGLGRLLGWVGVDVGAPGGRTVGGRAATVGTAP